MSATLPSQLEQGQVLTGIILFSGNPMILEVAAAAGIDFVIVDMEHSPLDLEQCGHLMRAADAAGIVPVVRVPEVDRALIAKVLNLGAAGIAVPHATVEDCAAALRAVRYAPEGERGACPLVRSARYAPADWNGYARDANRRVSVIPLIEDKATLENFDALCEMDGLDVFFIGPTDLSIALGVPGATFEDPAMSVALDRVAKAARSRGKQVMTTIGNKLDPAYGRMVVERGVHYIVLGTDGHLFLDVCRRMNQVKQKA
jgi:4-hydroxy-2-oxoheptanedioate aldolase